MSNGRDRAGRREPAAGRVLGDDAHLDGVPVEADVVLGRAAAARPAATRQLELDQVEAGDRLGDGVLDLEPGVDLEEGDLCRRRRRGTRPCRRSRSRRGGPARARRRSSAWRVGVVDAGRGRLLDHLLVAALDRALALAEVDHVAVGVAEDLDLDVAAAFEVPLDEHGAVAERRPRLADARGDGVGQLVGRRARCACPGRRRRPPP